MIKAVLFDLDGTLLPLEQETFLREYLQRLAAKVAGLVPPDRFVKQLMASTLAMTANREADRTNQQIFAADFYPKLGVPEETLMPILEDFYERDFGNIRTIVTPDPAARQAVTAVLARGLDAVVATNPVFPMTAIRQRLDWAGLADLPFKLVTSYEDSHFCKPNPEYFLEVASRTGRQPESCLMVGNDVGEDLVAASVGMRTYLVKDHLINPSGAKPKADHIGTLAELAAFLRSPEFGVL
ncbi:MAG: HAD family hydrolase [Symbiobacteriia bacterium]